MSEVNSDLSPCSYAVHQALGIWQLQARPPAQRSGPSPDTGTPSRDDQSACSFSNEGIYDLANIQVPGTPAGKELGQMVATVTPVDHLGQRSAPSRTSRR